MTESRDSTTTGLRPMFAISHHHTSPRAGRSVTNVQPPHGTTPSPPTRRAPRAGAGHRPARRRHAPLLPAAAPAMPQAPRPRARRPSALPAAGARYRSGSGPPSYSAVCDACHAGSNFPKPGPGAVPRRSLRGVQYAGPRTVTAPSSAPGDPPPPGSPGWQMGSRCPSDYRMRQDQPFPSRTRTPPRLLTVTRPTRLLIDAPRLETLSELKRPSRLRRRNTRPMPRTVRRAAYPYRFGPAGAVLLRLGMGRTAETGGSRTRQSVRR